MLARLILSPRCTFAFLLVLSLLGGAQDGRCDDAQERHRQAFHKNVAPLLQSYCLDCHGSKSPDGDLDLSQFESPRQILEGRKTWLKVLKKLKSGEMPPEDAEPLAESQRQQLAEWIDTTINEIDCTGEVEPGRVTLRRLNRVEYRNTIRDLLAVDYQPAEDFPADDVGYGFDNIGDVLSLPTILMEKYLTAAEQISEQAIVTQLSPSVVRHAGGKLQATAGSLVDNDARLLATAGEMWMEIEFPSSGEYQVSIQACGDQAGDEPIKMELRLDGRRKETFDVPQTRDRPTSFAARFAVEKGKHKLAVAFLNDYYNPQAADRNRRDRNLLVLGVEIQGPRNRPSEDLPAAHRRIIFTRPNESLSSDDAARQVLRRFAGRAFRRPASDQEVERLGKLAEQVRQEGGSFEEGIQLAIQALLVSPHFLYRVEQDPTDNHARRLDDFELASRISYFLWSSMPDEELFELARAGALREGDNLRKQVMRMLHDDKARALVENFAMQWLTLRNLDSMTPDKGLFPAFDDSLRADMLTETRLFVESVIREDQSVFRLIDADYTFVNQRLAKHYGLTGVQGKEFRRLSLEGTPRGGVLTQASVLTVTSNPTRTSPVKRGKWILDTLLGEPPPPPAADVPQLDDQPQLRGTLRQRLEQHRANPSCAACHEQMDPLGFALENFDAIGAYRTHDGESPIDATGKLPDGSPFEGPAQLKKVLLSSKRKQYVRCLTEKLLTFALGRGLEYYDQCAVDKITEKLEREDYRFSSLVAGIAASTPFQWRGTRKGKH